MKEIEKLPDVVYPKGVGIDGLSAKLIKREGPICMYERSDMIWEVFKVKTRRTTTIKGIVYPTHEVYPGNEDFGNNAWCFNTLVSATNRFNFMVEYEFKVGSKNRCRTGAEQVQTELSSTN